MANKYVCDRCGADIHKNGRFFKLKGRDAKYISCRPMIHVFFGDGADECWCDLCYTCYKDLRNWLKRPTELLEVLEIEKEGKDETR